MTRLLEIGLSNALVATLLAVVVFVVARWVRRPALVHALWVLVLAKLVTAPMLGVPIGFGVTLPNPVPVASDSHSAIDDAPVVTTAQPVVSKTERATLHILPDIESDGATPKAIRTPERAQRVSDSLTSVANSSPRSPAADVVRRPAVTTPPGNASTHPNATGWRWPEITLVRALATVWGTGTFLVVALQFLAVVRCSRWLGNGGRAVDDIQREAEAVAAELGIARSPRVWIVSTPLPPMLYALGPFARVVLPSPLLRDVDDTTRRLLLAHELAHYRRGDHWVRLLEMVAVALFWWHPVVWWARREIHETEEVCCDALVVDHVSRTPRVYAEALLDTVDFLSPTPAAAPVASGLGSVESIRRRLTAIMNRNVATSIDPGAWWAVAVFGAIVLPLTPTEFGVPTPSLAAPSFDSGDVAPPTDRSAARNGTSDRTRRTVFVPRGSFSDLLDARSRTAKPVVWARVRSDRSPATIAATTDRRVRFSNPVTDVEVELTSERITGAVLLRDTGTFVTSHEDGRLLLRDAGTAESLTAVRGHEAAIRSIAVAPDGQRLMSGAADGSLRAWDLDQVRGAIHTVGSPIDMGRPVNCVRFAPDGKSLLIGLGDWRTPDSGRVLVLPLDEARHPSSSGATVTVDLETSVAAVWFEGDHTLAAEWNGHVTILDPATGSRLDVGRASKDEIGAAAFSSESPVPTFVPAPVLEPEPVFTFGGDVWFAEPTPARGVPVEPFDFVVPSPNP